MVAGAWDLVTAVVVTFNSSAVLSPCLQLLTKAKRVILVDNDSDDDTIAVAQAVLPSIEIVRNPSNMGYGTANNIGFERAETPFVLLLNPDAQIRPGCLERLVTAAETYPDAAVIVPLLRSSEGAPECYGRGFKEFQFHRLDTVPEGPFCTGFVAGTAMLWRLDKWKAIGGFDERFFMYGEDHDLMLRVEDAGFAMILEPAAETLHLSGKSSRRVLKMVLRRDWHIMWGTFQVEAKWRTAAPVRRKARLAVLKYGWKALLYLALLRPRRALGNVVKAHAATSWLLDRPSWSGRGPKP